MRYEQCKIGRVEQGIDFYILVLKFYKVLTTDNMEERAKQIAELLKVLANDNRLMILCALMEAPMVVGEIARYVPNITPSALSQHLALLKAHGILDSAKSGQHITYAIADHRVEEIIQVLKTHYCETV